MNADRQDTSFKVICLLSAVGVGFALGGMFVELARPCPTCEEPECPACESVATETRAEPEYPEGFPLENWVCVTTEEDYKLMNWAGDLEQAAEIYEDTVAEQQLELEWWRKHCDYKAAEEDRDIQLQRDLNELRRRLRLRAVERALDDLEEPEVK